MNFYQSHGNEMETKPANSRPYVVQNIPLQSFHAQQVFRRGFDSYSDAIYSLSVVLRAVGTESQVCDMEGLIDEKLNKAQADIHNEIIRLEKVAENNGITLDAINYSHPAVVEARISSHRSAKYAGIIREFDGMIAKLDAMWLSGTIPDQEYSRILYEWKRRILRIATHVRGVVRQAMIESRKKPQQENPVDVPSVSDDAVSLQETSIINDASNSSESSESSVTRNTAAPGAFSWLRADR